MPGLLPSIACSAVPQARGRIPIPFFDIAAAPLLLCCSIGLAAGPGFVLSAAADSQPTNMQFLLDTAEQAVDGALADLDLTQLDTPGETAVVLTSQGKHAGDWVVEHLLVEAMLSRGFTVAQDSAAAAPSWPHLSYRVLDLAIGGNSGVLRGSVQRRCRVNISLRLAVGGEVLGVSEFSREATDRISRRQVSSLESPGYAFAKTDLQEQSWGKYVEPVIVSSVLGSLVYLFFSNR